MSKEFSTVLQLGAKAPFILIMQLNKQERCEFIQQVSPGMARVLKLSVLEGNDE